VVDHIRGPRVLSHSGPDQQLSQHLYGSIILSCASKVLSVGFPPTLTTNFSASRIHIHCISYSYFNSTGASEKYFPTISPVINQDILGGHCPMPDVRLEGFSPHRSSDRYYSSIISSGLPWPFLSILSSIPRFYIGWNQNPFTSRCLMPVAG